MQYIYIYICIRIYLYIYIYIYIQCLRARRPHHPGDAVDHVHGMGEAVERHGQVLLDMIRVVYDDNSNTYQPITDIHQFHISIIKQTHTHTHTWTKLWNATDRYSWARSCSYLGLVCL